MPRGDGTDGTFNPDEWMEPKEQRKVDDFIVFAMAAARQALDDADWHPRAYDDQISHRRADRLRDRRHGGHRARRAHPARQGRGGG
jgi:3-oxoacyl-(acyl-carrier-protein) synthase